MGKKVKVGNRPPVGGQEFIEALFEKVLERNWTHVLLLAVIGLSEKFQANDCLLSAEETESLGLAVQCLYGIYQRSTERQN